MIIIKANRRVLNKGAVLCLHQWVEKSHLKVRPNPRWPTLRFLQHLGATRRCTKCGRKLIVLDDQR